MKPFRERLAIVVWCLVSMWAAAWCVAGFMMLAQGKPDWLDFFGLGLGSACFMAAVASMFQFLLVGSWRLKDLFK